jgi:alcohol dehydrogenase (cytochrome c)
VADYKTGYSTTLAPLAIRGKVVVEVSGGEAGIRGLSMPDAASGKQAWRFWTIPGPSEPGHDSWQGDSWKTGGGPTWVTGSYDPELNLVYWGVGNPSPDWNGDPRRGDNLYTCSLLALDAIPGICAGTFSSLLTTRMTGTPIMSRCCSMRKSKASRASWS